MTNTALRNARLRAGLSQQELGKRAGVSVNYVSLLERGRLIPSIEKAWAIADHLGSDIQALFPRGGR